MDLEVTQCVPIWWTVGTERHCRWLAQGDSITGHYYSLAGLEHFPRWVVGGMDCLSQLEHFFSKESL